MTSVYAKAAVSGPAWVIANDSLLELAAPLGKHPPQFPAYLAAVVVAAGVTASAVVAALFIFSLFLTALTSSPPSVERVDTQK